jgi:NADH-quinone oxidoreductase subunit A
MLRADPLLQFFLARGVKRQQVKITVRAPVQHSAIVIHHRVDDGVRRAAVFCLHVVDRLADFHVRVVTEQHLGMRSLDRRRPNAPLRAAFDRLRLNGYYTFSPMSGSGLHAYAPLLIYLLLATALAGALTAVSVLIGWRRPNRAKLQAYECGMEPTGDAREPFSVKFYLVAMVFILFDVEAIFLYPWAYIYRDMIRQSVPMGRYGFVEMLVYIAILLVGYIYLWKKGALDWHKG